MDLGNTKAKFDSAIDNTKEVAETAHKKTNEFHEKYVSKVTPEMGKYGDAAKFAAELVPGVSEYNAVREGDWTGFAINAGIDIGTFAVGGIAGRAAIKGVSPVAKGVVKKATKEIAESGVKKATKEVVEGGVKKAAKETVEAGTEKVAKEATEAGAEKVAKEVAEADVEKAAKDVAEDAGEKAAKETLEVGTEKTAKESVEAGVEKTTKEVTEDAGEKVAKEISETEAKKTATDGIEKTAKETEKVSRAELYSSRIDRIKKCPLKDGEKNFFEGERGNSKCYSKLEEVNKELKKHDQDGIEYKDGVIDLSKVSEETVKIDMTPYRHNKGNIVGNFEKADAECAKNWNFQMRDGKSDWTSTDVKNWRRDNGYTWHECSDMKHCELVSRIIHDNFMHSGGVYECRLRDGLTTAGGGFDE